MTIYIESLFILNYFFDFLILMMINITLKRNIKLKKILLCTLIGEVSILFFLVKNIYLLMVLKLSLAILMILVTFSYKDIIYTINNLIYFFMISIILGGFIYYLKLSSISYYFSILLGPFIMLLYYYQNKNLKSCVNQTYPVTFYFDNNRKLDVVGFLDTGNRLRDPISKKYVVLVNKKLLKNVVSTKYPYYVSYKSLNNSGIVKCIKLEKMYMNGTYYTNLLIGLMDDKISINSVDCILNYCLWEEKNV